MIRKAVVLAAGKGTRLMPLTLAMPKEMIRVGTKPVIEHVIEVLKAGGIKEILVIVGRNKEAIMNYLGSGERLGVDIYYRIQEDPKGSADAVSLGKDFVGSEEFVVIYGDNYFKPYSAIKNVLKAHQEKRSDCTVLLHSVKDPTRFGLVKVDKNNKILSIIEKPTLEQAQVYKNDNVFFTIAGLLVLNKRIFEFIKATKIGIKDEIWLTDSVELLRENGGKVFGYRFSGVRFDIGTFDSLRLADQIEKDKH